MEFARHGHGRKRRHRNVYRRGAPLVFRLLSRIQSINGSKVQSLTPAQVKACAGFVFSGCCLFRACLQNTERGRPRPQQCLRNGSFRQFQMARQSQVCCARGRARSNSILKTRPRNFASRDTIVPLFLALCHGRCKACHHRPRQVAPFLRC
jgi:hypothetical protein